MTSKANDDTLPIQGFSQDLSIDITVDEDFIPASQPHSNESSKATKKSESSPKSDVNDRLSKSTIENTVLPNITINENDESADFIPETETKKRKLDHTKEETNFRKKIQIDENLMKCTEDMFEGQNDSWNLQPMKDSESLVIETQDTTAKVPETPVKDTQNVSKVPESPQNISGFNETFPAVDKTENKSLGLESEKRNEQSVTEVIVDDSAETIDLDMSENLSLVQEKKQRKMSVEKIDLSASFISDAERFEETQIFDHSSALIIELPAQSKGSEKREISTISQNMYMQETIDNGDCSKAESKTVCSANELDLPAVAVLSKELSEEHRNPLENSNQQNGEFCFKTEPTATSTAPNSPEPSNSSFLQTKKMEFKLLVSCMVTMNVKTKEVVQKLILNVNEIQKCKPKPKYIEYICDGMSDKSKRSSMSSSGSVYSDKTGLPFPLPKRVSAVSDQTDASDSSEEGFSKRLKEGSRVLGRTPWSNEYLLPLKMDEIMKTAIEGQDLQNRSNGSSSPHKQESTKCNGTHHLDEILESSSSEETSICNGGGGAQIAADVNLSLEKTKEDKETTDLNNSKKNADFSLEKVNESNKSISPIEKENSGEKENSIAEPSAPEQSEKTETQNTSEVTEQQQKPIEKSTEQQEEIKDSEEDNSPVVLCEGLVVMARWSADKQYYSGTLFGTPKGNRWDVKFDDGTIKTVKENFFIPAKWLKKGELVFALDQEEYFSGQIVDVKPEKKLPYVVELDNESKIVSVKLSDIRLSEVMVGIVKEKHRIIFTTPGGKGSSEIDFDNVLSGKRLREQRTPLKPTTVQTGSGAKKKSSAKVNKETPKDKNDSQKIRGLNTENGHLVEDKIISTDSPSGNEGVETPFRSGPREVRGKAKPRSLSYEVKEKTQKTPKLSDWLAPDGTPIPGPSGVKFKKRTKPGGKNVESFSKSVLDSVQEESSTPKRLRSSRDEKTPTSTKRKEPKSEEKTKERKNAKKQKVEETKSKAGSKSTKTKSKK